MMKKYLLLKNIPNSRLECTNHTLFQTKTGVEIDTLLQTKTAKKPYPLAPHIAYIAYVRDYPPRGGTAYTINNLLAIYG